MISMILRNYIGQVIQELRKERGMTYRELSEKSNVALGYVWEVEHGRKEVSSELLERIAFALNVKVSQIVIEAGMTMQMFESIDLITQEEVLA